MRNRLFVVLAGVLGLTSLLVPSERPQVLEEAASTAATLGGRDDNDGKP